MNKGRIKEAVRGMVDQVFVLGGIALVGYGAWQVYEPAAFIVVGLAVFWMGLPEK